METDSFFDKFSENYQKQSRYRYLWYRWLIDNIIAEVKPAKKTRILDLGTGTGELALRLSAKFPDAEIVGIDLSEGMLEQARKQAAQANLTNVRFLVSDIEKLDFGKQKWDYIISNLAFHHVKDKKRAIEKATQALNTNGKLIIGDFFEPSAKYVAMVDTLRKENQKLSKEYDESWVLFVKNISGDYATKHPEEFLVCSLALADIFEESKLKSETKSCLFDKLAIIVGSK